MFSYSFFLFVYNSVPVTGAEYTPIVELGCCVILIRDISYLKISFKSFSYCLVMVQIIY